VKGHSVATIHSADKVAWELVNHRFREPPIVPRWSVPRHDPHQPTHGLIARPRSWRCLWRAQLGNLAGTIANDFTLGLYERNPSFITVYDKDRYRFAPGWAFGGSATIPIIWVEPDFSGDGGCDRIMRHGHQPEYRYECIALVISIWHSGTAEDQLIVSSQENHLELQLAIAQQIIGSTVATFREESLYCRDHVIFRS
jgi:hypothetical protein